MLVTQGRIIKVQHQDYLFERSSESPGAVYVTVRAPDGEQQLRLPTNPTDVEGFIAAYRRVVSEDVGYRKQEVE